MYLTKKKKEIIKEAIFNYEFFAGRMVSTKENISRSTSTEEAAELEKVLNEYYENWQKAFEKLKEYGLV